MTSPAKPRSAEASTTLELRALLRLPKPTLIGICRERHVPTVGTKQEIAERLVQSAAASSDKEAGGAIRIEKNAQGHYIHAPTGLVFSPVHRWVIGRWDATERCVRALRRADVQMCNKYKFNYVRPDTLDDYDIIHEILEGNKEAVGDTLSSADTDDDLDADEDIDVLSENEII